ncbi:hypothetical protein SANTM175S_01409 [Streptomyces antimycoticus]
MNSNPDQTKETRLPPAVTFTSGAHLLMQMGIVESITREGIRYIADHNEAWPFGPDKPFRTGKAGKAAGEIGRVGGASYLHTLVQNTPTAANAEYYAEIVRERAVLRRLTEAGTRIASSVTPAEGDIDEVQNRAEAEMVDVFAGREQSTSYAPVRQDVPVYWDKLDARMKGANGKHRCPTGSPIWTP